MPARYRGMRAAISALSTSMAVLLCGQAMAAERLIAVQSASSGIRAYAGMAVFSRWDGSAYHLAVSTAGGAPVDLPAPTQNTLFDADIGPDAEGRPAIVYSACASGECSLHRLRLGAGAPTELKSTHAPGQRELHPSLWRGRVAFVRLDASGRRPLLYVKRLAGGRSLRLPGVPSGGAATGVELSGDRVALLTQRPLRDAGVCGVPGVALVSIPTRRARTVANVLCGLNGQHYVGPTFAGGHLYFARTCGGAGGRCGARPYGIYRLKLRTGRYEQADSPGAPLLAWSYDANGRAYEVYDPADGCTQPEFQPDSPCRIARRSGLRFNAVRRPFSSWE